jgi:hypothetical protein
MSSRCSRSWRAIFIHRFDSGDDGLMIPGIA